MGGRPNLDEKELKDRTKQFALRIIKLIDALPDSTAGRTIASQLVRAGLSVGANYRAACRGRSKAEFLAKLGTALEESDECTYFLELIMDGELLPKDWVKPLYQEAHELTAIFVKSIYTVKSSIKNLKS
jgi:four helix bundle protein